MHEFIGRFRHEPVGVAAILFILGMVVLTLVAPLIYTVDPSEISNETLRPPSGVHLLGTATHN